MTVTSPYPIIEIYTGDDKTLALILNACEDKVKSLEGEKISLLSDGSTATQIVFKLDDICDHQKFYLNLVDSIKIEQKKRKVERRQKFFIKLGWSVFEAACIVTLYKILTL